MITIGIDASRAEAKIKTGVERYSYELIRAMRESLPEGARVVLYSRVPLPSELGPFNDNWKNVVLNWSPKRFWTQLRLSWEMFRRSPDVLFVPSHELPRIIPKRTVKTVHDAFFIDFPKLFPWKERLFLKATLSDACRRASEIIVPSNYVAAQIEEWRLGNVTVIPHGVRPLLGTSPVARRTSDLQATTRAPEQKLGAGQAYKLQPKPYFLVLGRIEKKKNLGVVISAFEQFYKDHPGYKLYFIGKFANGADKIVERAQKSAAVTNIEFLGALPDEETFRMMAGAVALLHPCPYEGFGFPAIEAMSLGVPAIVANAGAVAEAVGDAGLLVPPADAAKWAEAMNQITFDIFRKTLILQGRLRAAEFSWGKCAVRTWRLLLG
jgi:alpha-1,3-rhamnosyl/mannosyltransferase